MRDYFWNASWTPIRQLLLTARCDVHEKCQEGIQHIGPGEIGMKFQIYVIFKVILMIDVSGIYYQITLRWMSVNLSNDKSTLAQVMAWCRQATSHYLSHLLTQADVTGHNELIICYIFTATQWTHGPGHKLTIYHNRSCLEYLCGQVISSHGRDDSEGLNKQSSSTFHLGHFFLSLKPLLGRILQLNLQFIYWWVGARKM